jgi:hypothetical protein
MRKSGQADLPLHGGKAPRWLFSRMVRLSRVFIELVLIEFGPDKFIDMLSDPYWFQAFGSFLGFDWHSSGLTTTTLGAIKMALSELPPNIGIFIAGGKGKTMRKTPVEIEYTAKYLKISPEKLKSISKIAAKVDSAWIQDGYNIYHHNIIYTSDGKWTVIQQGMNPKNKYARRYHWHYKHINDTLTTPHSGIDTKELEKKVFNLTTKKSEPTKQSILQLFHEIKPSEIESIFKSLSEKQNSLFMPAHHDVRLKFSGNLKKVILSTYENPPKNIHELALSKLGPASTRALAMAASLLYGSDIDFTDPAVYSYAHGGKDGHPYPVNIKIYENTIAILEKIARSPGEESKRARKILQQLANLLK